jgi:protein-S-isoprenylcysteine O-methyltransferase Ste14
MTNVTVSVALLVVLSAGTVAASYHAWRNREVYGYYRFFAFEAIALSIAWNAGRWFRDPVSSRQIASWALLVAGTLLAIHGSYLLRVMGRAEQRGIEDTSALVGIGAYRYIRHPLYASLILLAWAVFLKGADLASAAFAVVATILLFATARSEERFNIKRFGSPYSEYMKRTKMFIPFVL